MPVLFPLAVFLSAALLFLVEPMFARMMLPLLGGAPAVWNTCVVFYQTLLFAGYAWAHLLARRTTLRQQTMLHVALLAAGLATLPIAIAPSWTPPPVANPVGWVFVLLAAGVGLPFFALSVTGPLLQHWVGSIEHRSSANPYVLYVASNAGSLLALLAYPLLLEPALRLGTQSRLWTGLYALLLAAVGGCSLQAWRAERRRSPRAASTDGTEIPGRKDRRSTSAPADDWSREPIGWLGLALVPSSLMLSVTTYISTDIAAVPLLWIVPLSLYLLTFIIAFAERQWISPRLVQAVFPLAALGIVAMALAQHVFPARLTIASQLLCFFVIALRCHQQLAASRPPAARLTEFYLWVSAGGAIGGLFTTLIAPLLFVGALEYPLVAAAACVFLPAAPSSSNGTWARMRPWIAALVPALLVAVLVRVLAAAGDWVEDSTTIRYVFVFLIPLAVCYLLRHRPPQMALALALLMFQGSFVRFNSYVPIFVERTFFGEHRVVFDGKERLLTSGTTNHGAQSADPAMKCEPLSYYSRRGPIGQLFDRIDASKTRFGVIGLGTGSLGAYASPGQTWTFFELNPAVERLARDPAFFTYLRDCAPQANVVIGDARLSLERVPDGSFDVLFVDAFTSDAIPVHLLTTDAVQLYLRKLSPKGILAVHISNRYLDLSPVVAAVSRAAGATAMEQFHVPDAAEMRISDEIARARWVVVARDPATLGSLTNDHRWQSLADVTGPVWTDDYSNVVRTIRWPQ